MADEVEKEVSEDVEGQKLHRASRTEDEVPGSDAERVPSRTSFSDSDEDVEGQGLRTRAS